MSGGLPSDNGALLANGEKGVRAHLLMIPYPAPPHIGPMLNFARQLVDSGDVTVTLVSFRHFIDRLVLAESKREDRSERLQLVGVPDDLPGFNPPSELPMDPIVLRETLQLGHNMGPFVDKLLQKRQHSTAPEDQGPTCIVSDYINSWTIGLAKKLNIPRYALSASSASLLLLLALQKEYTAEHEKLKRGESDLIVAPLLPPLHYRVTWFIRQPFFLSQGWLKSLEDAEGILVNTFFELEQQSIIELRRKMPHKTVLPIGPLGLSPASFAAKPISVEGLQVPDDEWRTWMDSQPPASVVYINFGTTGMNVLSLRHVHELAKGLETSQERFLWVLRAPPQLIDLNLNELLPAGFEERVKGRGMILTGWAPQLQILAHPSTGGFMSPCGWNSALESVAFGVPVLSWPSFADQPLSSSFMVTNAKTAIALPQQEDFFVEAQDIAMAVRNLLQSEEGQTLRERARELKAASAAAMAEGGSTHQSIQQFIRLVKQHPHSPWP